MPRKTTTVRRKSRKAAGKRPSGEPGSVIRAEFRERYQDGSCGDDLAVRLRKHVTSKDGGIDAAKLRALAEANGAWQARYASLNPGMQRMNVGNRLRKLVRDGGKVVWS